MTGERVYEITLQTPRGAHRLQVTAAEHILDAAERAGITLPFICRQGRCLTCAGIVIGEGQFDYSDADLYFPQDVEQGFILLCSSKPKSDLHIRTHAELEMRQHRLNNGVPAPYS